MKVSPTLDATALRLDIPGFDWQANEINSYFIKKINIDFNRQRLYISEPFNL